MLVPLAVISSELGSVMSILRDQGLSKTNLTAFYPIRGPTCTQPVEDDVMAHWELSVSRTAE